MSDFLDGNVKNMFTMINEEGISQISSLEEIPDKYDGGFITERHGGILFCHTVKPCDRVVENYRTLLGWIWVNNS